MRRLAAITFALLMTVCSAAAIAQEPAAAQQSALQRLVEEQLRRIEALEARIALLQQQMDALRGQQPPAPATADEPEAPVTYDHATGGTPPVDPDAEEPVADLPRALNVDAYGSLRVLTASDTDGHFEVRNNASRLGIRGQKELFGGIEAFGRYEMGINLVANDRAILNTGGDPGSPIGQGSQAITSRLGFVGFETAIGNFSWGKQWSPYYDVAEFSDQAQVFTGTAHGAFGAGTDGGIVGTGRAERAVQYRGRWGLLSGGLQVQNRSLTVNDRQWADTYGGSLTVGRQNGFAVGAAYNEVRDGVPTPTINEPQIGDKATIFGIRFRSDRFYAGSTYSILEQHEVDDLGRRFDGRGFELALRQHVAERVWIEGVFNDLSPDDSHPGGYRIRFGAANVVYNFGVASRLFAGYKVEGSRRSDRTDLTKSTFAAGLNYTF